MTGAALHTLQELEPARRRAATPRLVLLKSHERPDAAPDAVSQLAAQYEGVLQHLAAEIDFLRAQLREQERQHVLKDALLKNARIREQSLRAELCR